MADAQSYEGGCHCGAVRYTATVDTSQAIECNCSHCSAKGFILTFIPASTFTLNKGDGALTEYQFNKKMISHLFCKTCGVQSFARGKGPDGAEMAAINVRCLDGIDLAALTPAKVNGKDF
ncbi:MAG: GFA family protein [Caulobacterales bacterium]